MERGHNFGEEKLSISEFPSNFPRTSEPSLELAVEIPKKKKKIPVAEVVLASFDDIYNPSTFNKHIYTEKK